MLCLCVYGYDYQIDISGPGPQNQPLNHGLINLIGCAVLKISSIVSSSERLCGRS